MPNPPLRAAEQVVHASMFQLRTLVVVVFLVASTALAQSASPALPPVDRELARSVFQQLIETNTTDSVGSTTVAAEAMRKRLLAAGFAAADLQIVGGKPNRMNLVARYRGVAGSAEKPVLIIGHIDVVEANRSDWSMDPFVLHEQDGYFYGRGTQDMKSGDAEFVTAFILLKRAGFVPKRDFILALTADEETGADNGVDWILQHRRDLIGDAAFAINPDAGGLELEDGKPKRMLLEATEKVYADFQFKATNPGGHSSLPVPDNAIYELADALVRLQHAPFPAELNNTTRAYLEQVLPAEQPARQALIRGVLRSPMDADAAAKLSVDPSYNALLHTTCVATTAKAGHSPNALPAAAEANVNCRILPGHSAEEVRRQLVQVVADPRVSVAYVNDDGSVSATAPERFTMAPPPLRADLMGPLRAVVARLYPGLPIVPEQESGASDSVYTMQAGIPSYGFTGIGVDANDMRAHGRDERLRVQSYYAGVEFTTQLLRALGSE